MIQVEYGTVTSGLEPWVVGEVIVRPELNCFEQHHPFLIQSLQQNYIRPSVSNEGSQSLKLYNHGEVVPISFLFTMV